jgi:hypothetical protein
VPTEPAATIRSVELREEAERYCALIEQAESWERQAFAVALVVSLAELLAAASHLPDGEPTDSVSADTPTQEQWSERYAAVQQTLGDWAHYWTTPAAHGDGASEAVLLSLADDLADIWRDLKHGLLALACGAPPADVTWEWRFGFSTHWSRHATEALRAVHARLADAGGPAVAAVRART